MSRRYRSPIPGLVSAHDAAWLSTSAGRRCKYRRQLCVERGAEMALRIGRLHAVHQFPALDQDAGVVECALEILARQQALFEQRVAEIGPIALGCAAERRILVICGCDD